MWGTAQPTKLFSLENRNEFFELTLKFQVLIRVTNQLQINLLKIHYNYLQRFLYLVAIFKFNFQKTLLGE